MNIKWSLEDGIEECSSKYILNTGDIPVRDTMITDVEAAEGSQKIVKIRVKVNYMRSLLTGYSEV